MSNQQQVAPAWNGQQWMVWTGTEWIPAPPQAQAKKKHSPIAIILIVIIGLAIGGWVGSCMNSVPTPNKAACPAASAAPGDLVGSFKQGLSDGYNRCP